MFVRFISFFAIIIFTLLQPAQAQDQAKIERQFQTWLQQDLWPQAKSAGISRRTFKTAFANVTLDWKLPDLVPPGATAKVPTEQSQAEFGAPSRYFGRNGLEGATSMGRRMSRLHADSLSRVEQVTGVPSHVILAIWGRESAYGRAKIPHNVFRVLGTKAFMSTRAPYFREELLAALQIAQEGHVPATHMKSSWAGAMGQPQFMPSNFLAYSRDGDGDQRADIWTSEADTLMSIGHFLAEHGWQKNRDWGFEVSVPPSISCSLEGPDQGRRISEWESLGITRVSGRPFPAHERSGQGYLMMPAGRLGPAFLVTPNFYVLKDYNKSDLYALFVGHVGDRIAYGVGNFSTSWKPLDRLYRSEIAGIQRSLESLGHDVGGADGLVGFKTRRSIGRWQEAQGLTPTCFPDAALSATLAK